MGDFHTQPEANALRHAPVTELHKQGSAMFLCWPTNAIDLAKNDSDLPEMVDKLAQFIANWEAKGAKAREWQPIETAPPAGTIIDIWMVLPSGHGARWTSVMWGDAARRWIGGPPSQDSKGWKATHWMRVPGSPVVPLERSGGAT